MVSKAVQEQIDKAVEEALTHAVEASSKPHLVPQLRETWRKSSQHLAEQGKRFARLFIASAIPAVASAIFSPHFDSKTLLALLVPVLETTYRQIYPALGAQGVDDAPGVTIVPEQVSLPVEGDGPPDAV